MRMTLNTKPPKFINAATVAFLTCFASAQSEIEIAGINLDELQNSGFRINWINQSPTEGLHLPTIQDDSFYTVDNSDYVSKYNIKSGDWLWSSPVGNQTYKIKGISEIPDLKRTYVLSEGDVYVLESNTGNYPSSENKNNKNNEQHFKLRETANSSNATYNNKMVYGSTTGNAVWFDPEIGFTASTYNVGSSISVPPVLVTGIRSKQGLIRNAIIASSTDGTVTAIDAKDVRQVWSIKLLDSVSAPIAFVTNTITNVNEDIPRTSVFIAGNDHYLRAVDLHTGKPRWRVLTQSPLLDSPFVFGGTVFQKIPSVGLAAFVAFPDDFSGKQKWLSQEVTGTPITTTDKGKLVCWDEQLRVLQIIDTRKGGIINTVQLPLAKHLITDNSTNGSLFLITDNDTILRLDSRR
jgi:hypothetical protein